MNMVGLRPRNSFSGNICFKFSVLCLCRVSVSELTDRVGDMVEVVFIKEMFEYKYWDISVLIRFNYI
jgi:hypothetical protein